MSAFKALRDVSTNFEEYLRKVSNDLFTARIEEPFEDLISKKLNDLSLYKSKLRLLQANSLAASSQTSPPGEETITNYEDTVKWKIVEQLVVKNITQSHHVKALLTAPGSTLNPDMLERKELIQEQLRKFRDKEMELRQLDEMVQEGQGRLEEVRREWDTQLTLLNEQRADMNEVNDQSGPIGSKMRTLESKLNVIRQLMARLATARGGDYDWMADPHHRLRALQLARQHSTSD